jgi:hypothetical protein
LEDCNPNIHLTFVGKRMFKVLVDEVDCLRAVKK